MNAYFNPSLIKREITLKIEGLRPILPKPRIAIAQTFGGGDKRYAVYALLHCGEALVPADHKSYISTIEATHSSSQRRTMRSAISSSSQIADQV